MVDLAKTRGKVSRTGEGFLARCPAHDDDRASLSIGEGKDGKVLVRCHAGCTFNEITSAFGLSAQQLFPSNGSAVRTHTSPKPHRNGNGERPASAQPKAEIVAEYPYTDADGAVVYTVCRNARKEFPVRLPDGTWKWPAESERVLFGLPEIIEAVAQDRLVVFVEGEKDALRLRSSGMAATTKMGGAESKWLPQYSDSLRGGHVVIVPDNDTAGMKCAQAVYAAVQPVAASVRIVTLPGLGEKGDVSDWLDLGHSVEEFLELCTPKLITIEDVAVRFQKWLHLPDLMPVYAVIGTIGANLLPGDPVWLGIVAPPSSAKTEILNALGKLPNIHPAATITPASLLSGTSKKERAVGAKGGLLRQIGDYGILILKDFGSVLSMRPDAKTEVLAALREVYDGSWTRHIGTDGGQTLTWSGKVGLLFGVTPALDSHHSVIGAMGERFLLCRLPAAGREQATRALSHAGSGTAQMRTELSEVISMLFSQPRREPRSLSAEEGQQLVELASLAVRLRSTVERDRNSREIESVHGAEGPARLVLSLERLLAGLDSMGCDRDLALAVVSRVAMDSVPPLRRRAYDWLRERQTEEDTTVVANALKLPTSTTRRILEDLSAYDLVLRRTDGEGKAHRWIIAEDDR